MTALPVAGAPIAGEPRRPSLQSVLARQQRMAKVPFMLVLALVMALGMVGLLVLTTALQNQAFAVQERQREANELGYRLSDLDAQVNQARSASNLAIRAQELGMKPNPYPVLLRLPDGAVVGQPEKVTGGEVPSVRYATPEQANAQQQAAGKAGSPATSAAATNQQTTEVAAEDGNVADTQTGGTR